MQNSLKAKAEKEIVRLKNLAGENFSVSEITEKPYNFEFTANGNGEKVKVQVYFGKKGVKTVLQGNRENGLYGKLNDLLLGADSLFPQVGEKSVVPARYIGSDESGKGDFFGPLVVAAFYADETATRELYSLGVRDSKTLSENRITEIAGAIEEKFPENFSIKIFEPQEYNEKYAESGKNLNKLLIYAHSEVIKPLIAKFNADFVIIDKFSERAFSMENDIRFANVKFVKETKAEKYPAVAAASVLARAKVNEWFEKINEKLRKTDGIELPKGASAQVDEVARYIVEKYSKKALTRLAKTHFRNFSKIL